MNGFGICVLRYRPLQALAWPAVMVGALVLSAVSRVGTASLLIFGTLWVAEVAHNANTLWRGIPVEVRVSQGLIRWRARFRQEAIPLASIRRVRCNTLPTTMVVLEFDGHPSRIVAVTGGFADFLEALTVTCPWIDVSADVVERFGSWTGKTFGFFIEPTEGA